MKKTTILILLSFAVMALSAKVYYVSPTGDNSDGTTWDKAFTSILEAQANVTAPAEIWVKQGTYNVTDTTLTIINGISVYGGFAGTETSFDARSTDPSLTILKGNNERRVVTAASDLTEETTWDGFTIQDGKSATGGGVYLRGNATMSNCIIQNNVNKTNSGGGVYIAATDSIPVKLLNCTVRNNIVYNDGTNGNPLGGGGVYIHTNSHGAIVSDCTIEKNTIDGINFTGARMYGAGVYMAAGSLLNSTISNNLATSVDGKTGEVKAVGQLSGGGVGVMTPASGNVLIKGCKIESNSTLIHQGGGLAINPHWTTSPVKGKVTVENTIISNNYSRNQGGGVLCDSQNDGSTAEYLFINCVIANNEADYHPGGGVFINNKLPSTVKFIGNTIANNRMNTYNYGGAGIFYNNIPTSLVNCLFWGNLNAGEEPLKHHLRNKDVDGNTITYCAFDTRFQEDDIVAPATVENLVSLDLSNDGAGDSFVKFKNPTSFTGIAKTEEEKQEIAEADWSLTEGSACIDKGATERTYNYDINGAERGMGEGYDIGAYEFDPTPPQSVKNPGAELFIAYGIRGGIVIENTNNFTQASVYNLQGAHCRTVELSAGQNTINIDSGLYIIKVENKAAKVLVK